uniref:Uncharacterized protein n=1 Tax=Tanacetum cinerariifolium TaxID=118510 RepID=A0A699HRJ0_TANCI|nr:hypothetical protein [Tanacetum cinerariifolium]
MALFNAISQLSPIQNSCLQQLGFGKLLNFKVNSIPSKLGFYVVDNFDDKETEIRLKKESIKISMDSIVDMIGIINKCVDIKDVDIVKDEEMIKNWEDQFGTNKVKPNDVKYMIRKSKVADMNFKLNFIVLFTSIMGGVKTKGFCDLSVLDHINTSTILSNINWCIYIWRCLKKCKNGWIRDKTNSYFLGSITLLTMLYVDGTVCNDFKIGRKRPPTTMWTSELVKERELAEIKSGGLGKGEPAGPYVEEEDDPMPDNLEGFIWKMNNYVDCIKIKRAGFEKTLDVAKKCVRTDDPTMKNQRKEPSLEIDEDFDTPMGPDTQLVVFESADSEEKQLAVYLFSKMVGDVRTQLYQLFIAKKQVKKAVIRKRKKDEDIDDMKVVSILHKNFSQYLLAINHGNVAEIIEAQLENGNVDLMMKVKKHNTQLGCLRNKYAAKILLSDCNMYKSKILEEMEKMKSAIFNVKAIKVSQRGK